ncbi:MAG: CRISPR-associated protein Cas1, partial [Planctomycetaceae bacterium]|nr:CRISPR-associated protein Cas1 [Planctomycetaceae bacterium]
MSAPAGPLPPNPETPLIATDAASANADGGSIRHEPPAANASVRDDADLLPVRMLNEFTYCPRLAYLEFIHGEFTDNLETKQGTFGHRNVDRPSSAKVPAAAAPVATPAAADAAVLDGVLPEKTDLIQKGTNLPCLHARSLMLSSATDGLIAKLDVLELDGNVATPVDYKRGSIPDIPERAWEPERVQLCAQGLILRDAGYQCERGELYYIESKRRVTIEFDETLVNRTRQLARDFREVIAKSQMPPPLVDSPKCPRCALVGICLPDETNLLTHSLPASGESENSLAAAGSNLASDRKVLTGQAVESTQQPKPIRNLLPSRPEALPFYVQEQGAYVGKDGDRIVAKYKDEKLASTPLIDVSQVSLFGNVQMSAQILREVTSRGIPICHFSYGGWFHALTSSLIHKNVELRQAQFAIAAEPIRSLSLARGFILAKMKNCRTLLRRHATDQHRGELDQLADYIRKAEQAASAETLLGLEGTAARLYFQGFARLLKGGPAFNLNGRNRRPPTDPVNALLSFLYSLLAKELTITLHAVGFDPMLGFFHRPQYGRPSLALDLAEEFRPLIGDSVVLTLINNAEVGASDFVCRGGAVALTDRGRKSVLTAWERRLETEITHPLFGYRISYRRVLEVQARLLSRV